MKQTVAETSTSIYGAGVGLGTRLPVCDHDGPAPVYIALLSSISLFIYLDWI